MTIKQFLAETTFKHDDVITIVHPHDRMSCCQVTIQALNLN